MSEPGAGSAVPSEHDLYLALLMLLESITSYNDARVRESPVYQQKTVGHTVIAALQEATIAGMTECSILHGSRNCCSSCARALILYVSIAIPCVFRQVSYR